MIYLPSGEPSLHVPTHGRRVRFGVFEADLHSGELYKQGLKIKLQDRPFQILALLLERPGELVTRQELRDRLWSADTFVDFDVGLNTAVKRLRDALGDDAETPRFIETLHRRGYRFLAPVQRESAAVTAQAAPPADAKPAPHPEQASHGLQPKRRIPLAWIALAASVPLLVAFGVPRVRHIFLPAAAARIQSIAVLPLENLSGDPGQEYFADGMTDALITDLARINSLRVISRTSVMRYKTARKPLAQIARELNVDAIVVGSVVRSGKRVRINAQLFQASPERQLWANAYERDLANVVSLQDEVARAVAGEIQINLTPQERALLETGQQVQPAAYEAYLKGRYFWNLRTVDSLRKTVAYFQEAIQDEPDYALEVLDSFSDRKIETISNVTLRPVMDKTTTDGLSPFAVLGRIYELARRKALNVDDALERWLWQGPPAASVAGGRRARPAGGRRPGGGGGCVWPGAGLQEPPDPPPARVVGAAVSAPAQAPRPAPVGLRRRRGPSSAGGATKASPSGSPPDAGATT